MDFSIACEFESLVVSDHSRVWVTIYTESDWLTKKNLGWTGEVFSFHSLSLPKAETKPNQTNQNTMLIIMNSKTCKGPQLVAFTSGNLIWILHRIVSSSITGYNILYNNQFFPQILDILDVRMLFILEPILVPFTERKSVEVRNIEDHNLEFLFLSVNY